MRLETEGTLIVDARGMRCPWPALRLARAMRERVDVLLIADDPQAGREIAALADEHGWQIDSEIGVDATDRWRIRRG
ncbi:tRNA 2-thiouridine synthesizing protein A [Sphingopyxis panaciterrae]|uniref:sulfurtransferase TusA family protein n=1 Tax=Sphingopyxis panaciterrae TaxID=363841 RepID=UPI00141DF5FA|nr:sulfurtransferase TusA family protein [Sphingopyxis panaciterrae]NIJ35361.1 tRNA 2-thiouridine synthesizing protein A [Sphingopyxis panaciterrae]